MTISLKTRLIVPENVLYRQLEGESVLLNLDTESYFGLDDVGTRMWETLTRSDTIELAYDALLDEYDVDPEKLKSDLSDLVENLVNKGLLETESE